MSHVGNARLVEFSFGAESLLNCLILLYKNSKTRKNDVINTCRNYFDVTYMCRSIVNMLRKHNGSQRSGIKFYWHAMY